MIAQLLPWKWLVRRLAKSHGIVDPFSILARVRKFAEPSEVEAPLELIRAWIVFQARGIVNTRAIQHNLDWVWPYWVERQFNPRDPSFVPRSFSLSHINLTHRNWTAVCVPDADCYALVDPRGLVTPLHDGWSLDAWIVGDGVSVVPSRCREASQVMRCEGGLAIETALDRNGTRLVIHAEVRRHEHNDPCLNVVYEAESARPATLCVALRPYNPEGIQFIDFVEAMDDAPGWRVNRETRVCLDQEPRRYVASTYQAGDVFNLLDVAPPERGKGCPVGMVTAAALFPLDGGSAERVTLSVPLSTRAGLFALESAKMRPRTSWAELDNLSPILDIPDDRMTYLYRTATRTLLALSAGEVFPGPYTYRRFWFRDACIILNVLLTLNHDECCRRAMDDSFLRRQTMAGFFESQQGEWDSNGQVLWLAGRYASVSRKPLAARVVKALRKGADWLCRKRLPRIPEQAHRGLLPSGFSAEHLGPNNCYYWDNFWGVAGLRASVDLFQEDGDTDYANKLKAIADEYRYDILASIEAVSQERCGGGIPAAPSRRMDAGAVGSLVADYPLQLFGPADARIMQTVEFLLRNCMIDNGFFHDMTHSGINPYLTLHLAQVLLRAGDSRYAPLMRRVAELASPTGQWPEAIHPKTGGGCMGDGQHGWAAAEWVLMVRSLFVREEADGLVVCPGLLPEWLNSGKTLRFGPTATRFGSVTVEVDTAKSPPNVTVAGNWHAEPPAISIAIPMLNAQ
jgi:hypothetical protein